MFHAFTIDMSYLDYEKFLSLLHFISDFFDASDDDLRLFFDAADVRSLIELLESKRR